MKKLLSILGALGIVGSSAMSVVSCSRGEDLIGLVTDSGGDTNDNGFNQSAFEAGNNFYENVLGINKKTKVAKSNSSNDIIDGYRVMAKTKSLKAMLMPGFNHGEHLQEANKAMELIDKDGIFIDGHSNGSSNIIGLMYRSDISGFYAGMASIIYEFQANKDKTEVKLGTFGGVRNFEAVDPYMMGFLASVDAFNLFIQNENFKTMFGLNDGRTLIAKKAPTNSEDPVSESDKKWFSESFSETEGQVQAKQLVNDDVDVGMVVAAAQTAQLIHASQEKGNITKIVGVDTDQVKKYSNLKDMFITSAKKSIFESTQLAMAHSRGFKDDEKVKESLDNGILSEYDKTLSPVVQTTTEKSDDDTWSGKDVWIGGAISSGGKNLVSNELAQTLKSFFATDVMLHASTTYFTLINKNKDVKTSLGTKTIQQYAKQIFDEITHA